MTDRVGTCSLCGGAVVTSGYTRLATQGDNRSSFARVRPLARSLHLVRASAE